MAHFQHLTVTQTEVLFSSRCLTAKRSAILVEQQMVSQMMTVETLVA